MTQTEKQFMELLRAGLWGKPADAELFKGSVDWKDILRIGSEQTVAVIAADGMETLPKDLLPPKKAILMLMMLRVKTTQMHTLINNTIVQIVRALDKQDIPSALLKGQGIAQLYRNPESRTCGDIDLYTGESGYRKAAEIIESMHEGRGHKEAIECAHHLHTSLNGIEVEIHRFADIMIGKKQNANFQKWTVESIDNHFGTGNLETWDNEGTAVTLPSPTFNAFFILQHAVRHMTTEGVGLRQICDWTMLLHKYHDQIDTELLSKKLKEMHMEEVWKEFGILAVTALGLPEEELPLAPACIKPTRKTAKIMRHIFISGNFGRHDENAKDKSQTTYFKRKWRSFRYQSLRLIKLFSLFPRYTASYTWNWLSAAIIKVITRSDR